MRLEEEINKMVVEIEEIKKMNEWKEEFIPEFEELLKNVILVKN